MEAIERSCSFTSAFVFVRVIGCFLYFKININKYIDLRLSVAPVDNETHIYFNYLFYLSEYSETLNVEDIFTDISWKWRDS